MDSKRGLLHFFFLQSNLSYKYKNPGSSKAFRALFKHEGCYAITCYLYDLIKQQVFLLPFSQRGDYEESQKYLEGLVVPWTCNGPQLLQALIDIKLYPKQPQRHNLEYFNREKDFFSQGVIHAALKNSDKSFEAFKSIAAWEPWPTQVIHHLFPNELSSVKKDPRFSTLSEHINRDWSK